MIDDEKNEGLQHRFAELADVIPTRENRIVPTDVTDEDIGREVKIYMGPRMQRAKLLSVEGRALRVEFPDGRSRLVPWFRCAFEEE